MLGYYNDSPGSQRYPRVIAPFFPDTANFRRFCQRFRVAPVAGGFDRRLPCPRDGADAGAGDLDARPRLVGRDGHGVRSLGHGQVQRVVG